MGCLSVVVCCLPVRFVWRELYYTLLVYLCSTDLSRVYRAFLIIIGVVYSKKIEKRRRGRQKQQKTTTTTAGGNLLCLQSPLVLSTYIGGGDFRESGLLQAFCPREISRST